MRVRLRIAGLLALVFAFMIADSVMQTILPLSMTQTGAVSVALIGVMIAIPQGIGFITALPGTAHGDAHGRARVTAVYAALAAVAAAAIATAAVGQSALWWIAPLALFGLSRLTVWLSILATVSTTGDRLRMQGFNGATQRLAAALAAFVSAAVIAGHAWEWGYALISAACLVVVVLALAVLPRSVRTEEPLATPRASYGVAVSLVRRDGAIQASGLAALSCMTVMLVGNSFFALTMNVSAGELAALVAVLLVTRDLASVLMGMAFKPLVNLVGMSGTVALAVLCGAASMFVLLAAGTALPGIVCAAVLQGTSICLLIGSTNLLAVTSTGTATAGAGLRLAASQIGPSVGALLMPVILAAALGFGGTWLLYTLACGAILLLGGTALFAMRASPTAPNSPDDQVTILMKDGENHEPHQCTRTS